MAKKTAYHLADEDAEFAQRSKDIFGDLDKVQNSLVLNKQDIKPVGSKRKTQDSEPVEEREEKNPDKPAFKTNPEKWTKYDLSETAETNDRQNTQAAFAFFYDIKKRRKSEEKPVETSSTTDDVDMKHEVEPNSEDKNKRIAFQKPAAFKMQEHVVGIAAGPKRKSVSTDAKKEACDKVELDHLENISATEFQAEIAGKLDENFPAAPKTDNPTVSGTFKHIHKSKRNMRTRKQSDNEDD